MTRGGAVRVAVAVAAALGVAGCACGARVHDGGAADGGARDAGSTADRPEPPRDGGGRRDSGFVLPDGGLPAAVVCDGLPVEPLPPCAVQDPARAGGCGGEGRVVFDGAHCQLARGAECAGERGAFRTFEQCAVACERAGYCNEGLVIPTGGGSLSTCVPPDRRLCEAGLEVRALLNLSGCEALGVPLDDCSAAGESSWYCVRYADPPEMPWPFFRRLSLLPVLLVVCIDHPL